MNKFLSGVFLLSFFADTAAVGTVCQSYTNTGDNLSGMVMSSKTSNCSNADFSSKFLQGVDFTGVNLSGAKFNGALGTPQGKKKTNFTSVNLKKAQFGQDTKGNGSDFSGAFFIGAYLNNAIMKHSFFKNANFSGAILIGADFTGSVLTGAKFSNASWADESTTMPNGKKYNRTNNNFGHYTG